MSLEALKAKLAGLKNQSPPVVAVIQEKVQELKVEATGEQKKELIDLTQIKQDTVTLPDAQDKALSELENHPLADKVDFIRGKLSDLSAAIELNAPGYKQILLVIDKILRTYKELTYLLSEEEIQVIVSGLIKDSDAQFVTTPASKGGGVGKKKSGKVVKDLDIGSEDDI